ncbi:MAG TPA: hypothetical protein VFY84_06805 [Jiangellales bacterium]|nr:hypothetical protein [Jiangellales bacterium]
MTTDVRAVIGRIPQLASAADGHRLTVWHLAAALSVPSGNTAVLWRAPTAEPSAEPDGGDARTTGSVTAATAPPASVGGAAPHPRFDPQARAVLEGALLVALQERADHIGTEHLLAALVRTGPADVVAWLAARNATAETVDALLSGLRGGLGVERLPAPMSRADRFIWWRATARVHGGPWRWRLLGAVVVVLTVTLVVLCVWGP